MSMLSTDKKPYYIVKNMSSCQDMSTDVGLPQALSDAKANAHLMNNNGRGGDDVSATAWPKASCLPHDPPQAPLPVAKDATNSHWANIVLYFLTAICMKAWR